MKALLRRMLCGVTGEAGGAMATSEPCLPFRAAFLALALRAGLAERAPRLATPLTGPLPAFAVVLRDLAGAAAFALL